MTIKDFLIKLQTEFDNKSKSEYSAFLVERFECENDIFLENILFISNDQKDYFVLVEQSREELEKNLISDLQRKIQVYTRKNFSGNDFISDHYERNSTLIIFVKSDVTTITETTLKTIMEIEEDPYLFKKQVVYLNKQESESLKSLLEEDSIEDRCHDIIENIDSYTEFRKALKNGIIQNHAIYSLVAKLYEKLPFLTFNVAEEEYQNVDELINNALINSDQNEEKNLLVLKNQLLAPDFDFGAYLDSYLKENEGKEERDE